MCALHLFDLVMTFLYFRLMTGIEYELIHGQDSILYVIRKQERHSPERGNLFTLYYILSYQLNLAHNVGFKFTNIYNRNGKKLRTREKPLKEPFHMTLLRV